MNRERKMGAALEYRQAAAATGRTPTTHDEIMQR